MNSTENREKAAAGEPRSPKAEPALGQTESGLPRLAYSTAEVAAILGVSYISVWRLVQRGLLKSSRAFRHLLIPLTEIQRFLKETTI